MPQPHPSQTRRPRALGRRCVIAALLSFGLLTMACDDSKSRAVTEEDSSDVLVTDTDVQTTDVDAQTTDVDAQLTDADVQTTDVDAQLTDADAQTTDVDAQLTDADAQTTDADVTDSCTPVPLSGTACEVEGETCGGCSESSCDWCNLLHCQAGVWGRLEAFPDPMCHLQYCNPLTEGVCEAGEGCYWVDDAGQFQCLPAGSQLEESACAEAGACLPGYLCVQRSTEQSPSCYQACNPDTDDGICGGPCDAMSEHGYQNGSGNPVADVGFCYFLGG